MCLYVGRDGNKPVDFTCPVPHKATLTVQFRIYSDGSRQGAIAPGHLGPCAVYLKKVDDMYANNSAAGPGWFKIWEDGLDTASGKWCVDRLIASKGLLSVNLPTGLPAGYYLVRPEILALHNAVDGDPQFYVGCAQIYVQQGPDGPLNIPDGQSVSIPGYVSADTPGVKFNIYKKPLPKYTIPGPKVFIPQGKPSSSSTAKQAQGGIRVDCILKNANWCAKQVPNFSTEDGCWAAVKNCYNQSKTCWSSAPPTGSANCKTWQDYCKKLESGCDSGQTKGPAEFKGKEIMAEVPGPIPKPWNDVFEAGKGDGSKSTMAVVTTTSTSTPVAKETDKEYSGGRSGGERRHVHRHQRQ